jgi:EmrB/QacA subfamily drug resistance transporter
MTEQTSTTEPTGWLRRRWWLLGVLGVAQLMLILDVTVVAIALPNIGEDLGLEREALTWVVSGYTLAFGGLLLLGGRIVDLVGSRPVVLTGLAVFTVASLVTGLADSGELLLAGRVAQGVGAAMLSPAALSLVVTTFEGDERNKALGIWSALGGGGAALGVLLGGILTAGPGWSWIFYVNVPLGAAVIIAVTVMLPSRSRAYGGQRLDLPGAVLVIAATGTLIYALIDAGDRGWLATGTLALLGVATVLYAAFFGWLRSTRTPLMDVGLLLRRPVASGTFMVLVATALMIAVFFLGSFYLQHHEDYGPLRTGLLFLPVAVATMVGANAAGRVIGRTGPRALAFVGLLVAAVGLAVPALASDPTAVVIGVAVGGAGTGAIFVVASATALGQVAPEEAGLASGIVSTFHEFGASLGAAVSSSVAAAGITVGSLSGIQRGFTVAAVTAVVASVVGLVALPPRQVPDAEPGDAPHPTGEPEQSLDRS